MLRIFREASKENYETYEHKLCTNRGRQYSPDIDSKCQCIILIVVVVENIYINFVCILLFNIKWLSNPELNVNFFHRYYYYCCYNCSASRDDVPNSTSLLWPFLGIDLLDLFPNCSICSQSLPHYHYPIDNFILPSCF